MMTERPPVTVPADGFNALAACRNGPMIYNRNDRYVGASLARYGEFSRGESALFRQIVRVGATVVEGGANIGAHTVELSRLVGGSGVIHAFEPQRIVFQTLCGNLALNSCANVHAYQAGLGAAAGAIRVPFIPPTQAANFGGVSLAGGEGEESAPLYTIDDLALPACHLIKLDVEGMELEALRGAERTVRAFRPMLFVENDRADRSEALATLLLSWGYRLYWHITPLFDPDNFAGVAENIFGEIHSFNLLCLPGERSISVTDMPEVTTAAEARPSFAQPEG
jgi:FkbM family methyltransferase